MHESEIDSRNLRLLRDMPRRRDRLVPRHYRAFKTFNTKKIQFLEAGVAHLVGNIAETPCARCVAGHCTFQECIVVRHFFGGSCTNCQINNASECSFRI